MARFVLARSLALCNCKSGRTKVQSERVLMWNSATWVLSTVFTVMYINKHRSNPTTAYQAAPPAYNGGDQAVPLEQKFAQTAPAQPSYQQTPQTQYSQPAPQGQFVQQPVYNQQPQYTGQYQDPINREQTVSPVSQAGYASPPQQPINYNSNPNASELGASQNPAGYNNPNVPELSNGK